MKNQKNAPVAQNVELEDAELDQVSGGVVARPDGGTCTDPYPLPPFFPKYPVPTRESF